MFQGRVLFAHNWTESYKSLLKKKKKGLGPQTKTEGCQRMPQNGEFFSLGHMMVAP